MGLDGMDIDAIILFQPFSGFKNPPKPWFWMG